MRIAHVHKTRGFRGWDMRDASTGAVLGTSQRFAHHFADDQLAKILA